MDSTVIEQLRNAYFAFFRGDMEEYEGRMRAARERIDTLSEDRRQMLGEWTLMSRLPCMNDVDALNRVMQEAGELLTERSVLVGDEMPFLNGGDSVLSLLWHRPGEIDAVSAKFKDVIRMFSALTGCGMGYDLFLDAEIAYYRGELDKAALLSHKTIYIASSTGQNLLAACAAGMLAQVARQRTDAAAWSYSLKVLERAGRNSRDGGRTESYIVSTRNQLFITLGDYANVPEWIREGDFHALPGRGPFGYRYRIDDPRVPHPRYSLNLLQHMMGLFFAKQYERMLAADAVAQLFGLTENALTMDAYCTQLRAFSLAALGNVQQAEREMEHVAALVVPDGMWLMAGEMAAFSGGLTAQMLKKHCPESSAHALSFGQGIQDRTLALRQAVREGEPLTRLTPREREIAKLAASGLRNKEIARKLNVTEQTVKFHLSNIYERLQIDGRAKLLRLLLAESGGTSFAEN